VSGRILGIERNIIHRLAALQVLIISIEAAIVHRSFYIPDLGAANGRQHPIGAQFDGHSSVAGGLIGAVSRVALILDPAKRYGTHQHTLSDLRIFIDEVTRIIRLLALQVLVIGAAMAYW